MTAQIRTTTTNGITQPTGLYADNAQGTAAINNFPASNLGAFGDLEAVTLTPLLQWS